MNPSTHLFWVTSRAAGTAALVLASVSLSVGLMIGGRMVSGRGRGSDLRTLHEALSLSALAMLALHGVALIGDSYLHPSLVQIAIPFAGSYRPLWTGIGVVAGWALIALALSYYWRERIGVDRWKALHRYTAVAWALAIVHTIGAGTDARTAWYLIVLILPVIPALAMLAVRLAGVSQRARARMAS